jgi:hypothetical protein
MIIINLIQLFSTVFIIANSKSAIPIISKKFALVFVWLVEISTGIALDKISTGIRGRRFLPSGSNQKVRGATVIRLKDYSCPIWASDGELDGRPPLGRECRWGARALPRGVGIALGSGFCGPRAAVGGRD